MQPPRATRPSNMAGVRAYSRWFEFSLSGCIREAGGGFFHSVSCVMWPHQGVETRFSTIFESTVYNLLRRILPMIYGDQTCFNVPTFQRTDIVRTTACTSCSSSTAKPREQRRRGNALSTGDVVVSLCPRFSHSKKSQLYCCAAEPECVEVPRRSSVVISNNPQPRRFHPVSH